MPKPTETPTPYRFARRAHLKLTPTSVTLDGHDISHLVTEGTVHFNPNPEWTRAVLGIVAAETGWEGDAQLYLKPGVAELLERYGWTPPADDDDAA